MLSFKEYLTEAKTANTVLSDINELYTGFILNGNKWYDPEAKKQYEMRVKQALPEEVADANGKATAMAHEFVKWAKAAGYSGAVKKVWWTARPGSMAAAVGEPVDQKKNPTDILVKFSSGPANGFLGLSAKATKTKGDIGFKNPGIGTVDRSLNLNLADVYKKELEGVIAKHDLPASTKDRKDHIRATPDVKVHTELAGSTMLSKLRDTLLIRIEKMDNETRKKYLLSDWMDAEIIYPPYLKVTGQGSKPPYHAVAMDPVQNDKLDALSKYEIKFQATGNESIGVLAGTKKIMKMRFKFESEKMASSVKMSGDPW